MRLILTLTAVAAFTLPSLAAPTSGPSAIDPRDVEKNYVRPIYCDNPGNIWCSTDQEYAICDHGMNVFFPLPPGDNRCKPGGSLSHA